MVFLAEMERFELSRRYSRPTPLAGAPLRPLEYISKGVCGLGGQIIRSGTANDEYYTLYPPLCQVFFVIFITGGVKNLFGPSTPPQILIFNMSQRHSGIPYSGVGYQSLKSALRYMTLSEAIASALSASKSSLRSSSSAYASSGRVLG